MRWEIDRVTAVDRFFIESGIGTYVIAHVGNRDP
ncbi:Uncharacterised protein [Vibrio cholerae]|nr:Uncharacterised protein [Vibrio cholerae]CSI25005.1 Uncharacterised protein [Vibrio cholerae]